MKFPLIWNFTLIWKISSHSLSDVRASSSAPCRTDACILASVEETVKWTNNNETDVNTVASRSVSALAWSSQVKPSTLYCEINDSTSFLSVCFSAVREDRMPGGRNSGAVYQLYKVIFYTPFLLYYLQYEMALFANRNLLQRKYGLFYESYR